MSRLWSRWLSRLKEQQGVGAARRRRVTPRLEALEERMVPSSMLTVNTTADTHAVNAAVSAADANGNISLRSALERANVEGGDTIMTPAGHYQLSLGALPVTNSVTVEGAGAAVTLIDAQQMDRVMTVTSDATTVKIENVTLENGKAPTGGFFSLGANDSGGGAVLDEGAANLNFVNSTLINNRAQGADSTASTAAGAGEGGAVYQYGGALTFTDSTVSNNTAQGGADNSGYGGGLGEGGGVATLLGTLAVQSSTFSVNLAIGGASATSVTAAAGEGGAIAYDAFHVGVGLTVADSTLANNFAIGGASTFGGGEGVGGNGRGGAVFDTSGASVTDSTVAGNQVAAGAGTAGSPAGEGGGFYFSGGEGVTFDVGGTIVATNTATTAGQDLFAVNAPVAPFTSLGNNLIGNNDQTTDGFVDGVNGDQVGGTAHGGTIDPGLGLLTDNGGPTETMAITDSSPAFEKGSVHNTAAFDQRGVSRPIGFQGDVGAYQTEEHLDAGGFNLLLELKQGDPTTLELFANGVLVDARVLSALDGYSVIDSGTATPPTPPSDFLTVDYGNGFFSPGGGVIFRGDATSRLTINDPNAATGQEYALTPPTPVPGVENQPAVQGPASTAQVGRLGTPVTYSGLYLLTVDAVSGAVLDIHGTANAAIVNVTGGNAVIRVAPDSGLLKNVLNGPLVINAGGGGNILAVAENNNNPTGDSLQVTATEIGELGPSPTFQIDYSGSYQVVGLTTGSGADQIGLFSTSAQVGQTNFDAGGGGDSVNVYVASSSHYRYPVLVGGETNFANDALTVFDVTGGAAFQTLPLDATHSIEEVSYSGADASNIVFSNFGSLKHS